MTENITEEQEWKGNHIKGRHANNGEVKDKNLGVRRKFKEEQKELYKASEKKRGSDQSGGNKHMEKRKARRSNREGR